MRGIVLFFWLILMPVLAHASPLRVQTGEHATFTRVVIGVPRDIDWQLGRTNEGYLLRLPTQDGFVLDQFFDLIPRERIVDVSQSPSAGELLIRVDCQCHAQAAMYRSNYLVIDIRDGPAPSVSPFELALSQNASVTPDPAPPQPSGATFRIARSSVLPLITPRFRQEEQSVETTQSVNADPVLDQPITKATTDEEQHKADTDTALQMIAQALGESLGRGLSDGLLQEDLTTGSDDGTVVEPDHAFVLEDGASLPGLNARTGIDPLAVGLSAAQPQTQIGQTCLPDSNFDIASWGDDRAPHIQLRNARSALIKPADQFEDGALRALAQLYIHLGFGHEARQTLDLDGVQSRDRIHLRAIARIIDEEPVAQDLFAGQVSCPSPVALWALLAQPQSPLDAQVDRTAVINAYRALPVYVQQPIAPRLAEALLSIAAEDEAMQVLGGQSTIPRNDVALALANAALSDALGDDAAAIEKVTDVARNDRRTNPEAMMRFFEEGAASGVAFSDADFLLADALRFENMDSGVATTLVEAQFGAYLSVDRFEDARDLLQKRASDLSAEQWASYREQLFRQATQRMPDAAFLELVWQENLDQDSVETQNTVAAHLLALDFPMQAMTVMTGDAIGALAAQQDALREQALRQAAAQQPTPDTNAITSAASADVPQSPDMLSIGSATLLNGRTLIESAEQSRATIRALLETFPAPTDF
ncbi:hypothetical protein [Roseobacter sp. CCS2]|uniref:hypothetical protein n=1 Tax=Roseobacter sp. CCS2 TaxID=391593 RepID=UPI0000F4024E|nr:hypothetical protein [Roseobacter sp. CCS2]EBA13845.1 hypothetical protein RCCS2_08149 [Roseobacter sp. CCS2]